MSRLASFLDGGYVDRIARDEFRVRLDYAKLSNALVAEIRNRSGESISLLRTYYYHCLPYQSAKPTAEEAKRFGQSRSFFDALASLPRTEVRLGRLAYRGTDSNGQPIFQQKRVDLMLGLDFALLAGKNQISHAVLFAGDSDLIPAVEVAKQEGVCVWLFTDRQDRVPTEPRLTRGSCGRQLTKELNSPRPLSRPSRGSS